MIMYSCMLYNHSCNIYHNCIIYNSLIHLLTPSLGQNVKPQSLSTMFSIKESSDLLYIADQYLIMRFAKITQPTSDQYIVRCAQLTPLTRDVQVSPHGGRSLTILENRWRGLLGILKTSLSPKDQRKLFIPFLKNITTGRVAISNHLFTYCGNCVMTQWTLRFQ